MEVAALETGSTGCINLIYSFSSPWTSQSGLWSLALIQGADLSAGAGPLFSIASSAMISSPSSFQLLLCAYNGTKMHTLTMSYVVFNRTKAYATNVFFSNFFFTSGSSGSYANLQQYTHYLGQLVRGIGGL